MLHNVSVISARIIITYTILYCMGLDSYCTMNELMHTFAKENRKSVTLSIKVLTSSTSSFCVTNAVLRIQGNSII